jgi:hypothetical protein
LDHLLEGGGGQVGDARIDDLLSAVLLVLVDHLAGAVGDLGDRDRRVVDAVGGEGAVRGRHPQRVDRVRSERGRVDGLELGVDPHQVGGLHDVLRTDLQDQLRVHNVDRVDRRLEQRQPAPEL